MNCPVAINTGYAILAGIVFFIACIELLSYYKSDVTIIPRTKGQLVGLLPPYKQTPNMEYVPPHIVQDNTTTNTSLKRQCTNALLRKFFKVHGYFPEDGEWSPDVSSYQPGACQFNMATAGDCFISKNQSDILIVGDSQGRRYFRALLGKLNSEGWNCEVSEDPNDLKLENNKTGLPANISSLNPMEKVLLNGCTTCQSTTVVCSDVARHQMQLTYKASWILIEKQIQPIFQKHYSQIKNQYQPPDLVLYFVALQHVKNKGPLEKECRPIVKNFVRLIKKYTDDNMEMYFVAPMSEIEEQKPKFWRHRKFEGMLASEKLYKLSRMLYSELGDMLGSAQSRKYGHINLVNMSAPRGSWGVDGVHYQDIWYQHVVNNIISQHCH